MKMMEKMQGGYVLVSDGEVKGTLPLPVAGLLSMESSEEIQKNIDDMLQKAWDMGISKEIDPFITLSFMALPVIPELRLTDQGLVDVTNFQFI